MVFAPAVWLSRSSLFDVICFAINRLFFTILRPVLVTQVTVATIVYQLLHLQVLMPIGALEHVDYWIAAATFTAFYFIFDDFSRVQSERCKILMYVRMWSGDLVVIWLKVETNDASHRRSNWIGIWES